jgi:hypothetical protein
MKSFSRSTWIGLVLLGATATWATSSLLFGTGTVKAILSPGTPADSRHAIGAIPESPHDEAGDPAVENFIDVGFQSGAVYPAGSPINDPSALGGFGPSDNNPRPVREDSKGRGLFLLAQPTILRHFLRGGSGMQVCLVNQTNQLLRFDACDSCLAIIQEAQDQDGEWKPIESAGPEPICGNSFHQVFLPSQHFWSFQAVRYRGEIETKLRFQLTLADGTHILSNEFDGSVNAEQFHLSEPVKATPSPKSDEN